MQHLEDVAREHLRPDFLQKVTKLCDTIKSRTACRSLGDIPLAGPAFAEYIKKVTESLNRNAKVSIVDSLTAGLENAAQFSYEKALKLYNKKISDFLSKKPLPQPWKLLEAEHDQIYGDCYRSLDKDLNGQNAITKKFFENFSNEICIYKGKGDDREVTGGRWFNTVKENIGKMKAACKAKLEVLWKKHMDKYFAEHKAHSEDIGNQFYQSFQALRGEYDTYKDFDGCAEKYETYVSWYEDKGVERLIASMRGTGEHIKERIANEKLAKEEMAKREKIEGEMAVRKCLS
jgi:hypothetical protein